MKINIKLIAMLFMMAISLSHGEVETASITNHTKSNVALKFHPQVADNWLGIYDSDELKLLFNRFDWDANSWHCKMLLEIAKPSSDWDGRMSIYQTSDMNFIVMKYQSKPKKSASIWIVYHLDISEKVISETMKGFGP